MFRKIKHIVLLVLFVMTTTGFSVSKHFCGSFLMDYSINSKAEPCCDDLGDCGCCRDEAEYHQLEDDFLFPIFIINIENEVEDIFPFCDSISIVNETDVFEKEILFHAKPPPSLTLQTQLSLFQTYLC